MNNILFGFIAVLIIGNIVYVYPKYQAVTTDATLEEHPYITKVADEVEQNIQSDVEKLVPVSLFSESPAVGAPSFEALNAALHSETVFRIKIWDTHHAVLWSDAPELIGKVFLDNEEVTEVLESGQRKIEMKRTAAAGIQKKELITESFYTNYIELYHPVKDANGTVVGIIEAYSTANDVLSRITSEFYKTAAESIGGSLIAILLAVAFKRKRRAS